MLFTSFKHHWVLFLALFLLVLMSLPLLYFSNLLKILDQQTKDIHPNRYDAHPMVGVSLNNQIEDRWLKEKEIMIEEAKHRGLTIKIKVAHNSLSRQIKQIANLVNQNIKILIVVPVSRGGLEEVLLEARRKGVKIIQYDELTAGPADLYLGVDYREIGRIQATILVKKIGPGNYFIFRGPKDSYKGEIIYSGQHEVLTAKSNAKINIVAVDILTAWSASEAVNKTRAILARQKLHGILAPNDMIAGEVIKFIKEQRLPLPIITGAGGEITACQLILKNEQLLTIYFDYRELAKSALFYAQEFSKNRGVAVSNTVSFKGKKIFAHLVEISPVTKDNLKSLLVDQMKVYTDQDINMD